MDVSFAPAKRAAVWPRPKREPGRWPEPALLLLPPGRRTADLPLLALPACLSTLETKLWPRFFGALGRMRKSSSRRSVMAVLLASSGVSGRAKHADMPASARASRLTRHGGEAAACRATPCADWLSTRPGAASFCLAFRLCPSLALRAAAARRCCASSQRAGERGDGHRPGAFEARRLHVDGCAEGSAKCGANAPALHARRHGDGQQSDTPDGTTRCTATCSESAAIMGGIPARLDARPRSRRMR